MQDTAINFCRVSFANPLLLPSGIITELPDHQKAITAGVGGVTLKSLTYDRRAGNPLPRVWKFNCGMINSVGLRNAGIEKGSQEIAQFIKANKQIPVIVSLFATKIKEFLSLVEKIVPLAPDFIELNLSCPNVEDELGKSLGMNAETARKVVKAIKKISGKVPILVKLSPNVVSIVDIAKACEDSGADGIVAINTVGPGMIIDIKKRKPVLGAKKGGVSGPAIFPIALRCVYDIYDAVKIPIIGIGGVSKWEDVVAMMLAGATLVGVGTAAYTRGMGVYNELLAGLCEYMNKEKIKRVHELVGSAHTSE